VLRVFADHYNSHRPHRSLNLNPPDLATRRRASRTRQRQPSSDETDSADSSTNTTSPHKPTLRTSHARTRRVREPEQVRSRAVTADACRTRDLQDKRDRQ
jgi:hypothetical protein